jgi:uncharacterized OsmC-like protein
MGRSSRRIAGGDVSEAYRVELRTVGGGPTALGSAGGHTVAVDRPASAGGRGLGFNGGQLLYLAVAACISNDLYREAATMGLTVTEVVVEVDGDFPKAGAASTPIEVVVDLTGDASHEQLRALLDRVVEVAEIPRSLLGATPVTVSARRVAGR